MKRQVVHDLSGDDFADMMRYGVMPLFRKEEHTFLLDLSLVCKMWHQIVHESKTMYLVFPEDSPRLIPEKFVKQFPLLDNLCISERFVQSCISLINLRILRITSTHKMTQRIDLSSLTTLEELSLQGRIFFTGISHLPRLNKLKYYLNSLRESYTINGLFKKQEDEIREIIGRLYYFSTDLYTLYEAWHFTGNGRCYIRDYVYDETLGCHVFTSHIVSSYKGQWKNGLRHGRGVLTLSKLHYTYEGEFSEGYASGRGVEYASDGKYIGQFLKGKRHGRGILYTEKVSDTPVECEWEDGDRVIDFVLPGEE